ncbi:MAG: hypothetical protein IPI50_06375 [Saprospiraceae bacterium]|nr:hypothetical protein [Saprospiraceae bacterium]
MDPKQNLIHTLITNHYVMLKPSSVAGVGVSPSATFRKDAGICLPRNQEIGFVWIKMR